MMRVPKDNRCCFKNIKEKTSYLPQAFMKSFFDVKKIGTAKGLVPQT